MLRPATSTDALVFPYPRTFYPVIRIFRSIGKKDTRCDWCFLILEAERTQQRELHSPSGSSFRYCTLQHTAEEEDMQVLVL